MDDYLVELKRNYFNNLRLYSHGSERYTEVHQELFQELMMNDNLDFKEETCEVGRCLTRGDVDEAWNKLRNYLERDPE